MIWLLGFAALLLAGLAGCPRPGARPAPRSRHSLTEQNRSAGPAVSALQAGQFYQAEQAARAVLASDPGNARARLVRAVARYGNTLHDFVPDLLRRLEAWFKGRDRDRGGLHRKLAWMEGQLALVDRDLAVAAAEPGVSLRLCLACWTRDWNHNGRIDRFDRLLFQIERDAAGREIPVGDPRRKPTFRFDLGDIYWARAFVAFQRALFNLVLAYELPRIEDLKQVLRGRVVIRLKHRRRVHRARKLILAGLAHAQRCRREYLAETDDEAEWVPNPRQKNHPLPLPVDQALYVTWEGMVRDLRALVRGEQGVSVKEIARLAYPSWPDPPRGFIHVGRLFSDPGDIAVDLGGLRGFNPRRRADVERLLRTVFGNKYVTRMRPSPIVKRLRRMKREVGRGKESLGRKLKYLFWLN